MTVPSSPEPDGEPRLGTLGDVAAVVALHADRIAEGFLVSLGPRFLGRLYRRIVVSRGAFLLIHDDARGPAGFVAVAENTHQLYREFLLRDGIRAGLAAAPTVLRRPRMVWETLRYGTGAGPGDVPSAEILAVAVAPRAAGRGVGSRLVVAALEELQARDVHAASVVTALDNAPALHMYARAGFRPRARTEVHRGVPQEVLVWP